MQTNEQQQVYEKARRRIRQKKGLYFHFALFLIGSLFLILINEVFNVGKKAYGDWFVWAILLWFFIWLIHCVNVFVFQRFFNKEWERKATDKLVAEHNAKVEKLEKDLIDQGVISPNPEKKNPDS